MEATDLLFEHIEVVDDDTDEEVEREEGAAHDKDDKVEVRPQVLLVSGLQVHAAYVNSVRHNLHPALERRLVQQ